MTKGERTRQRMVEAVIESVARQGFEFSSATTISKLAKVNRGLIVHYFSTMEKLFKAGMTEVSRFALGRTNELLLQHADVEDPVERYFLATFGWIEERPLYGQFLIGLILRASYEKKAAEPAAALFEGGRARLKELLEQGNKAKLYKIKDTAAVARMLHAVLMGNVVSFGMKPEAVAAARTNAIATAALIVKSAK